MSVAEAALQCMRKLVETDSNLTLSPNLRLELVNILARFKIWAGNVGILAPENASVDYRLRDDPDIADIILSMLKRLQSCIGQALNPPLQEEPDEQSSGEASKLGTANSSASSDTSSSIISLDSHVISLCQEDAFQSDDYSGIMIRQANEVIDRLYRLASVLRKPVSSREDIRVQDFITKLIAANEVEELEDIEDHVRCHIRANFKNIPQVIEERLISAAVFRRMKLRYKQHHQAKLRQDVKSSFGALSNNRSSGGTTNIAGSSISSPEGARTASQKSRSQVHAYGPFHNKALSATQASSINRSRLADYTKSAALSVMTRSAVARRQQLDVPPPPSDIDRRTKQVECPYCFRMISEEETIEPRWTRHILKDISPYVCLFSSCTTEDLLFNSPEEWLGHMQWQHTIVWNCQALGHEEAIFNTEHEFQNHIRSSHPGSFTESQLLQLTQQAALPAPNVFAMLAISFANGDSLTATANACPICHKFQVVSSSAVGNIEEPASAHQQQLQHHILEHLETIALLSLPDKEYVGLAESNVRQSSHDKLSIIMKWATLPSLSFDDDHSTRTAAAQIIDDELPHFEDLDYEESWDMVLQEVKPNFPEPDKDSLLQGLRDYMLSVKGSGLSTTPATLHHTSERFLQLSAEFPGLARYSEAQRISILLDEAGCRDQILETVKSGINDLWLPINEEYWPSSLSLSLLWKLKDLQQYFLLNSFTITDSAQWPSEHANLNTNAISWPQIPNNLEFGRFLGAGGGAQVAEVKGPNNGIFALKRFVRATSARRAKLQMQYIKSEIDILRRIRHRHYVTLVGSYTDYKFIGILMHPVADGDLEWFLNDVVTGSKDELLLAGFFGCLATALMDLHYKWRVRHKDIKPRNILVIRNRKSILLTDFGIALDWGDTGRTTTNQEKMRSPIYCAPEVAKDEPRNSMSDVWSLGCVFLEMAAVLKGKSRMFIQDILTKCGSPSYCNNPEGIQQVISELSSAKTKWNNDPLLWAEQMLKERKEDRPSSRELMLMILQVKGHGSQLYCGDCCKPDISLDSETVDIAPTSGSDIEHDTASSEGEAECGVPPSEGQEFTKVQQLMIQAAIDHALTSGTSFEDVNEMTEYLRSGGISEYLLGDRYLQARTNIWYNAIGAYKESMRHATTSAN